jgi:hypothetical protein
VLTRGLASTAAPGSAPVVDPCGQAGGKYKQTPVGGDSVFQTVAVPGDKTYQMGDLGSKVLPEHPDAVTTWKIGTTPRVAVSPLSAFCFVRAHLPGHTAIRELTDSRVWLVTC